MATRFCFLDYDREIAIVAEVEVDDHREAEFAILVGDAWQGLGLGSMLTDYCLEVCHR